MKYVVTLAGHTVEVELGLGGQVVVDGVEVRAQLEPGEAGAPPLLTLDGRAVTISAVREGRGQWRLGLDGLNLAVEALSERQQAIRALAGEKEGAAGGGVLKAPMPGLVVRVPVAVGDAVQVGDPLVVLEAMKMENELAATGPGVVTAVLVSPGTAVEKGVPLVEMGPIASG